MNPTAPRNLLDPLLANLSDPALLLQAATLLGLFALAYAVLRLIRHRLAPDQQARWREQRWNRVLLPLLTLPMVALARALFGDTPAHLLNLAVPLLTSFAIVQVSFHLLQRLFKPSAALRVFEHTISWLVWGALALHITGYLGALVAGLDAVGFSLGKQRLSLYTVFLGLVSISLTLIAALWIARLIEGRFIEATPLNPNIKMALAKLSRAVLLVLAVLIALPVVGIDITVLSVFGGALGVGLGLGLQKIASNYVSGFTLLLDQSVRIGDMVTVGDRFGQIQEIATRYTVIRSLDGTEAIIPNENLVTSVVINHTLANRINRVATAVQVAYGADLETARRLMLAAAAAQPRILHEPEPSVLLKGFGESGIDLELVFWINDPEEGQMGLRSDVNWAIWEGFRREGVEIPYPRRVVEIVQADPAG